MVLVLFKPTLMESRETYPSIQVQLRITHGLYAELLFDDTSINYGRTNVSIKSSRLHKYIKTVVSTANENKSTSKAANEIMNIPLTFC